MALKLTPKPSRRAIPSCFSQTSFAACALPTQAAPPTPQSISAFDGLCLAAGTCHGRNDLDMPRFQLHGRVLMLSDARQTVHLPHFSKLPRQHASLTSSGAVEWQMKVLLHSVWLSRSPVKINTMA